MRLRQQRFLLTADVEINQRDGQLAKSARAAQHMSVHQRLRPMQSAVIRGHAFEIAAMRLDLFETIGCRIVAVGAASHGQIAMRGVSVISLS